MGGTTSERISEKEPGISSDIHTTVMKEQTINNIRLGAFTALLGAVCGAVIWLFLRLTGICTHLLWDIIPERTGISWIPVIICTAGGLAAGLIHKRYGTYPEELQTVLVKIRREKHYDYGPMPVMLICAFLPLILGASVGPEAGMTGIIAGLCYWVGDNVRYAKEHAEEYSEIGAAVTLGSLFHIPLFGIFAVEENPEDDGEDGSGIGIPRTSKLVLYGLSIAAAFLVMKALGSILGAAGEGFPSFDYIEPVAADYVLILLYIPAGLFLYFAFEYAEKITSAVAGRIPVVVRETICGLCIGIMALIVPVVLFSGEEQMAKLSDVYMAYAPAALIGICFLKILLTAFCIRFGLKGGHFFPLIFGCSCMGFGLASAVFGSAAGITDPAVITGHAIFAAGTVTAAMLGAQMKKPIAVSLLLLLCFNVRYVLWLLLAAAVGGKASSLTAGSRKSSDK